MTALFVLYLPRQLRSKTKLLSDHAQGLLEASGDTIETLDLTREMPDLFTPERLAAYLDRNYSGQMLDADQMVLMAKMDRMTEQFKEADIVVTAFPMHNFSMPAIVKAYFDSVMLKGETWNSNEAGYYGIMKGKKALVLVSAGGEYQGDWKSFEHTVSLTKNEFQFMGFSQIESVFAQGLSMDPDKVPEIIQQAKENIDQILQEWTPSVVPS